MKVFTCAGFRGYYPVGTSAIVVAEGPLLAAALLQEELKKVGLSQDIDHRSMIEVDTMKPSCEILNDGNY